MQRGAGRRGAHPRSRGEHSEIRTKSTGDAGSSPLARGTLNNTLVPAVKTGLIPARAGNTSDHRQMLRPARAHPRSRGEHGRAIPGAAASAGSSPLARGTPETATATAPVAGLIPARAGNTGAAESTKTPTPAHPRSRGEHALALPMTAVSSGSSPLARGTHNAVIIL